MKLGRLLLMFVFRKIKPNLADLFLSSQLLLAYTTSAQYTIFELSMPLDPLKQLRYLSMKASNDIINIGILSRQHFR